MKRTLLLAALLSCVIGPCVVGPCVAGPCVAGPADAVPTTGSSTESSAPTTGNEVVARMASDRAALNSYQVRVAFTIDLHAFLSLRFSPHGTYYFKRPDKNGLVFDSLPAGAQQFQHFYGSMGTPETWPQAYDIALVSAPTASDSRYELKLVPKKASGVDRVMLAVDANTFGVVKESWFYKDGATIVMDQVNERVGGFLLPKEQIADFNFPSYKAHAVSDYDGYHLNVPLPDSVFSN